MCLKKLLCLEKIQCSRQYCSFFSLLSFLPYAWFDLCVDSCVCLFCTAFSVPTGSRVFVTLILQDTHLLCILTLNLIFSFSGLSSSFPAYKFVQNGSFYSSSFVYRRRKQKMWIRKQKSRKNAKLEIAAASTLDAVENAREGCQLIPGNFMQKANMSRKVDKYA